MSGTELLAEIADQGGRMHVLAALEGRAPLSGHMPPEDILEHEGAADADAAEQARVFVEAVDTWQDDTGYYDDTWTEFAEERFGDRADEIVPDGD